jgi:hypothetical protein
MVANYRCQHRETQHRLYKLQPTHLKVIQFTLLSTSC